MRNFETITNAQRLEICKVAYRAWKNHSFVDDNDTVSENLSIGIDTVLGRDSENIQSKPHVIGNFPSYTDEYIRQIIHVHNRGFYGEEIWGEIMYYRINDRAFNMLIDYYDKLVNPLIYPQRKINRGIGSIISKWLKKWK